MSPNTGYMSNHRYGFHIFAASRACHNRMCTVESYVLPVKWLEFGNLAPSCGRSCSRSRVKYLPSIGLQIIQSPFGSQLAVSSLVLIISAWISNYIHYDMWDEITYPFPNSNGATVEVWEWISYFIPLQWACGYLSMLGLKLIRVSKSTHWWWSVDASCCLWGNVRCQKLFLISSTIVSNICVPSTLLIPSWFPLDKLVAISHTTVSNAFSWLKMCAFSSETHWNLNPTGVIDSKSALVQVMTWHRTGDNNSLSQYRPSSLTHVCGTRGGWGVGWRWGCGGGGWWGGGWVNQKWWHSTAGPPFITWFNFNPSMDK